MSEQRGSEVRLIDELRMLRQRVAELEQVETERERAEEALKNALDESRQRRMEISALLEGSRAVLRYRDFQEAARRIFDTCKSLTGATAGYVALLTRDGTENEVLFLDSGGLPCTVDPGLPMPVRGLRAEAYRTGQVVYHNDFSHSEWVQLMPAGHVSLANVMFAPLAIGGQAVGLMGLANKPGGFTEDDARIVAAFGELASIALLNSRTLESLQDSEERLRSVVETANDAIVAADSQGNVVFWNRGAEIIFGYSVEEIVGKPLSTIMPEQFQDAHRQAITLATSTRQPKFPGKTVEMTALRRDRTEVPVELSLATWLTREGVFLTALIRDITERKQAEETLKGSEARYAAAQRLANIGSWDWDIRTGDLHWSERVEALFGFDRGEFGATYEAFLQCVHSDDRQHVVDSVNGCVEEGKDYAIEHRIVWPDGTVRWVSETGDVIRDDNGVAVRMLGIVQDITERKRAEERFLWELRVNTAVARLSSALISGTASIEDIAQMVLDQAKGLTGSEHGYVSTIDPDTGDAVAHTLTRMMEDQCRVSDKDRRIVFPVGPDGRYGGLWGHALNTRQGFFTNSPTDHEAAKGPPEGHVPIERFLSTPVLLGETLVGQIALANPGRDYTEKDLEGITRLGELYALAIQRQRAEEEIENVARFPSEDPAPVLRVGKDGTVLYANATSTSLLSEWNSGIGELAPDPISKLAAKVIESGSVDTIEIEHRGTIFSFAVVPIAEAAYVNLYARDVTERKRAEEQLRKHRDHLEELVLERTAELERSHRELRQLAAHVQDAREEERADVAREIHDELGQVLTGLGMDLSWLNNRLAEKPLNARSRSLLLNKISAMFSLVDRAIESVQKIAAELRPGVLDDFGLLAAIESQTRQFEDRTGIICSLDLGVDDARLDSPTSTALFRIVQEALTNVARHAEATGVAISLKRHDNKLTLIVKDNGRGFWGDELSRSTSLGFLGMRERTVALGGEFHVSSVPRKGTTVRVTVPLADPYEG